jgi:hypothetical protein
MVRGGDRRADRDQACIFGYPLVTVELTRRALADVARPRARARP